MNNIRFVFAAVTAPLVVPTLILALNLVVNGASGPLDDPDFWLLIRIITGFSYVGLLVAGLPTVLMLRTLERMSLGTLTIGGALGGIVGGVVYLLFLSLLLNHSFRIDPIELMIGAVFGISVASAFGLIAGVNHLREL